MMNSYAETGSGFNSNHGQTSRPAESQKQQNISSTWSYNNQLESMYYSGEHQPMFVSPYDGNAKHPNYPQYPSGTIHQPVPTPVVKCHEACCQHFQDRYPLNPAPLRYQPTGPVQPRYTDLPNPDTRQYFTDRRAVQSLSRKKVYTENSYPGIPDRRYPQYMGRGQLHMDSRQQMQMMRAQYPMYPPYWGSARGWTGPRMNCPPPPSYHQSINQGAQLQAGLKMTDGTHYIDPTTQKSLSSQHRRAVRTTGGTDIIRPVPDPKRTTLDQNSQSCYEFGYPTGFVPFSEVNKIQGGSLTSQGSNSSCKVPSEKQYHPHQMQYSMQSGDRSLMNCGNPINDLNYSMNFPLSGNDAYMRSGLEDGQSIADSRKMQYDSLSKKRPDLDLRQYLETWEDDEDESTRLPEALALGNTGAPYIVVDCRSLEGETAAKLQERFKTSAPQVTSSKSRSSSPNTEQKQSDEQPRRNENSDRTGGQIDFQNQPSYAPSMPTLLNDTDKNVWNSVNRDSEGVIGKRGAFQPLDCSKRDTNQDPKRDSHPNSDLAVHKISGTNESSNMSLDALVSYYGDNRRVVDGGYDFVEMTERLVNNTDKSPVNSRSVLDHTLPSEMSRPCDPRLQQSQLGNNPSIYNKVPSRYPTSNYQHFKSGIPTDPYYNYKQHTMSSNKYFGYDNSQIVDPNYEYHKIAAEFDNPRLYGNKDVLKDPRRMFHQEIEKNVESAFFDPMRKNQLADCFQDKTNLEFTSVDSEQFINPAIIKKSLDPREKMYSEKNHTTRDRIDSLNNESATQSEKTVLITSQNGPAEVFRVPYSPDKDASHKDNVVTLHAGGQSKSSTMTVEVPYVQQYSTLVKLSEEISRAENSEVKSTNGAESQSIDKSNSDEFKKPTSFKLKRVPNSKEWTVEGKECTGSTSTGEADCESTTSTTSSCEIESRDALKQSVTISSLNMPSLDDIRDGDVNSINIEERHSENKLNDGVLCSSKMCSTSDEINKNKYNVQLPQMAIVQPMKINQSSNEPLDASCGNNSKSLDDGSVKSNEKSDNTQIISKEIEFTAKNDISKHGNFRTHKKIQSGFSSSLPNCIASSSDDFLHSQGLTSSESKETFSPFHVYPDCDVNTQISDYFKIDERTPGEKIMDNSARVPSSPGVDAMFEDINDSNHTQLYESKSCNFQDLTDPNVTLANHNSHFQSFSSIFSEESDKIGRPDGSVLQMNDKKYLKNIFGDINRHEQEDKLLDSNSLNEVDSEKSDEAKKSPPIPIISLKLNETKKMWCIANKDESSLSDDSSERITMVDPEKTTSHCPEHLTNDTVRRLENDLARALQEESNRSFSKKYKSLEDPSTLLDLNENEPNSCCEAQTESDLNKLICEEIDKHNADSLSNILEMDMRRNYLALDEKLITDFEKENLTRLQNANKCRSLVKYCPRNKVILKLNESKCTDKYKILIFDKNGQDFSQRSYIEATYLDDAQSIVHDVIDQLIQRSVYICHQKNKSSGLCEYNKPKKIKLNVEVSCFDQSHLPATVIKFDNSNNQIRENKNQENILTTTTNFLLHEKENCEHYSVIKTVQSKSLNEKKAIRSIFSPQSEDEELSKSNDVDQPMEIEEENANNLDGGLLSSDKQALDLSYKRNSNTDNPTFDGLNDSQIPQVLISTSSNNDVGEEELNGFRSPKINSLSHENFENSTKEDLEIDEALELMGLATSNPIDTEAKNELNVEASLSGEVEKSLDALQNSLENNDDVESNFLESNGNSHAPTLTKEKDSPFRLQETNHKKGSDSESDSNNLTVLLNKTPIAEMSITENEIINVDSKTNDGAKSENSKFLSHNYFNKNQPEVFLSPSECLGIRYLDPLKSVQNSEIDKNEDLPSSINKISQDQLTLHGHGKRKCNEKNSSQENISKKQIKSCSSNIESQKLVALNSIGLKYRGDNNINIKPVIEDVESRLETSVIVRNNSCSSRVTGLPNGSWSNPYENTSILSKFKEVEENSVMLPVAINRNQQENENRINNVVLQYNLDPQCSNIIPIKTSLNQPKKDNSDLVDKGIDVNPSLKEAREHTQTVTRTINNLDSCPDSNEAPDSCSVPKYTNVTNKVTETTLSNKKSQSDSKCYLPGVIATNCTYQIAGVPLQKEMSPYCAGESIFLSTDEDKLYLKLSRLSYFYEYKRMKWQKYSKSSLKNNYPKDHARTVNNTNISESYEHFQSTKDCSLKSCSDIAGIELDLCDTNQEKFKVDTSDLALLTNEVRKHCVEAMNNADLNSKESPVALKDKGESLALKGKEIYCLRRDSLKILEPEAVLKEIFSPEPTPDDSESKENECPQSYLPQIKQVITGEVVSLSQPNTASIIQYNTVKVQNKLKDTSCLLNPNSNEMVFRCLDKPEAVALAEINEQDSSETKSNQDEVEDIQSISTLGNSVLIKGDVFTGSLKSPNISKNTLIQTDDISKIIGSQECLDFNSSDESKTVITCLSDSYCVNDESTVKSPKDKGEIFESVCAIYTSKTQSIDSPDDNSVVKHPSQHICTNNYSTPSPAAQEIVGLLCSDKIHESFQKLHHIETDDLEHDSEDKLKVGANECKVPTFIEENKVSDVTTHEVESSVDMRDSESIDVSKSPNIISDKNQENTNVNDMILDTKGILPMDSRTLEIERGSFQCTQDTMSTLLHERDSNQDFTTDYSVKSILEGHSIISKTYDSNLGDNFDPITDKNEENITSNVLTIFEDKIHESHQEREANITTTDKSYNNNSEIHCLEEDGEETVDPSNLKINSVQDSLINNHNLNKENPLQCLVEAALALENVESCILNNKIKLSSKSDTIIETKHDCTANTEESSGRENDLTPADKEIFSKFEETNYNLRASTRIVTSSSSNIIPCPKRKYTIKSSTFLNRTADKKSDQTGTEKIRSKKRKCGFTYPRSKRRKKVWKNKSVHECDVHLDPGEVICDNLTDDCELLKYTANSETKSIVDDNEAGEKEGNKYAQHVTPFEKSQDLGPESRLCIANHSDNDFGGPLIIANGHNSTESNLLCVNSNKMDEYVNNINVGDLEVMSENPSLFKENSVSIDSSSDPTLENSTSLVIIFEHLDDENSDKANLEDRKKEDSDIVLGSMDKSCSVLCLPQSDSNLDDCSELLTSEFSVNESCICPPELKLPVNSDGDRPKEKLYESLENETLSPKSTYNIEDSYSKYTVTCNQEILTANCYEELNENLVNDIGNWPFVEEEVAEFDNKSELPNKIPEEGRKIELKCSLPWKKIFNISRRKKSKESKKVSGLELGPAKVEVRLRAPSAEWKVISDFHENASPVVKVKRLILQRDSDLSSFSEKDSEEENEQKRQTVLPKDSDSLDVNMTVKNPILRNVTVDDHWQPVVLLTRNKKLDQMNISLDTKISSHGSPSPCSSSQSSCSLGEKSSCDFGDLESDSEDSDLVNDNISVSSRQSDDLEVVSKRPGINQSKDIFDTYKTVKPQVYETYSPSDCNNTFTGEKIYSPSDPHFSPEGMCQDSESNSSCGPVKHNDLLSNYKNQSVEQTSSENLTSADVQKVHPEKPSLSENNYSSELQEVCTSETNNINQQQKLKPTDLSLDQENSLLNRNDLDQSGGKPGTVSQDQLGKSCLQTITSVSPKRTDTVNSYDFGEEHLLVQSKLKSLLNNNLTDSLISPENADLSLSKDNDESFSEASIETNRKICKMPKNFFVRRRLKKNTGDSESLNDNSQLVEENPATKSDRTVTFSTIYESTSDPLAVGNQKDPASSKMSSDSQSEKNSGNNEHFSNSESEMSLVCDNSRLQCAYDLEDSSPVRLNESPLVEKFEVKQRLRNGGRGLKRPNEGHSKGDTKRRRKKCKTSNRCQECKMQFENKEELVRHNAYRHARRRELHHCLLCQRSFSSAVRHSLHVRGRSHRHLELTQRHTMHAMHHLLVGGEFPLIPPLSRAELRALQWRPAQPGYTHFYHELTPLQAALQEHNTDVSEDTLSEDRMPND